MCAVGDQAAVFSASSGQMSGRIDAFGTAPLEFVSKARQRAPSNFFLLEIALRKYPMVVPHLFAYADCSSTDSEFKYARNFSMTETIPMGKHKVNTLGLITWNGV